MIGCRVETGWATTRDDVFRKAYTGNMLWIRCVTSSTCHPYWVMNKSLAFKLIEDPTQQSVSLQWHHQLRPCTCNRWEAYNTKRRDFLECVDIYYLLKSGEMEVILLEYVNLTQLSPVTNRRPDRRTQRYCEKYCVLLSINKSCPCQRHEGEYRYCPTRSELGRKVQVSGEHDAPVALYPRKRTPVSTELENLWAEKPVLTIWEKRKISSRCRDSKAASSGHYTDFTVPDPYSW